MRGARACCPDQYILPFRPRKIEARLKTVLGPILNGIEVQISTFYNDTSANDPPT